MTAPSYLLFITTTALNVMRNRSVVILIVQARARDFLRIMDHLNIKNMKIMSQLSPQGKKFVFAHEMCSTTFLSVCSTLIMLSKILGHAELLPVLSFTVLPFFGQEGSVSRWAQSNNLKFICLKIYRDFLWGAILPIYSFLSSSANILKCNVLDQEKVSRKVCMNLSTFQF